MELVLERVWTYWVMVLKLSFTDDSSDKAMKRLVKASEKPDPAMPESARQALIDNSVQLLKLHTAVPTKLSEDDGKLKVEGKVVQIELADVNQFITNLGGTVQLREVKPR